MGFVTIVVPINNPKCTPTAQEVITSYPRIKRTSRSSAKRVQAHPNIMHLVINHYIPWNIKKNCTHQTKCDRFIYLYMPIYIYLHNRIYTDINLYIPIYTFQSPPTCNTQLSSNGRSFRKGPRCGPGMGQAITFSKNNWFHTRNDWFHTRNRWFRRQNNVWIKTNNCWSKNELSDSILTYLFTHTH